MKLEEVWKKYELKSTFNLSILPESIKKQGVLIKYAPKSVIVLRGEFPQYIYFIQSGTALGTRNYTNGNEYNYFQLDQNNGNIGLLEILARKEQYIATIVSMTEVEVLRIESAVIYDLVMSDMELMRRCTTLVAQDLYMRSGNDGLLYYFSGLDKVRFYLVDYYDKHRDGKEKVIVYSEYQEIASHIGVSIRTVGRSLKKLKEGGEILSVNKRVVLTEEKYKILLDNLWT